MLTSRRTIDIEWGDCDAAGIVFFPRYFAWFDACTGGLFRHAGFEKRTLLDAYRIVGFPAVDARARFLKPSTFGDQVIVESSIERWGRSSFDVRHRLRRGEELAVEGFETRVWAVRDEATGRLRGAPVPDEVKQRFAL
jgi:4-hydroxybenzoyl-CoA thioesterase